MATTFSALTLGLLTAVLSAQEVAYPPGVNKEIHEAVQRGLQWLARNQATDGSWRNAGGYGTYPAAMTGLAGMALVASGSTPTRGKYYSEVRQSVDFLMKNADSSTGVISVPQEEGRSMYGHGFATLYLASVFGMEEEPRKQEKLKRILDKAVTLIGSAQSSAGGWIYTPDSSSDEGSVTVTQVQALRACRMSGIIVDKKVIDRAVSYIKRCQNGDGSIRYSLNSGADGRPAITAAGVAVLYNAGVYDDQPFVEKAYEYCKKHIQVAVDSTGHHYYTHLYWSQALYQRGGKDWADYYSKKAAWLLKQQKKDGSWDGDGVGTVYGTSIALTILQLPYALAPIYQR
ncbi:MAG: terpene cyclase/mutase family protein [Planctomycetes bacterium]|nr:terpene cyclase/mutase family protein [Planctomycetota bacterium]MCC7063169.1 terpene cyclase/mutase family protein [Planctomycetota bacterium]